MLRRLLFFEAPFYYFIGMHQELANILLSIPHHDNDRLPSVRAIMKAYRVSSGTVQAALSSLSESGKIKRIQGKGCFWSSRDSSGSILFANAVPQVRETANEKLNRLFTDDWNRGFFKTEVPLPLMKELSQRYNVSQSVLRKMLNIKVSQGILMRVGRQYMFNRKRNPGSQAPLSEIIFVTRCNSWGGFTAESEREMDFLRMVYKKAGAEKYKLILLGINETSDRLIDRSGKNRKLSDFPNAVGAILSTLLVMEPLKLLHMFAMAKFPVAVWWEHPLQALPPRMLHRPNWAFFNSTFGPFPGLEMGRHLAAKGINQVAYISPYHNSSWSIDRLEGLRQAGLNVEEFTDKEFASPWDYKQIARTKVPKLSVEAFARDLLKRKIVSFIDNDNKFQDLPIVCVNDDVASVITEMNDEGMIHTSGQIFAFDNSAESYLQRIPSYEFNTQALVDHMFYYLENSDAYSHATKVQEILGQVVEK